MIFYVPDVVSIKEREATLAGVRLFGDHGAALTRPLIRRRDRHLIGHTPVGTQLSWCRDAGIRCAMVTHCGSEIVKGDTAEIEARVKQLGEERGIEATIARDGMTLVLR